MPHHAHNSQTAWVDAAVRGQTIAFAFQPIVPIDARRGTMHELLVRPAVAGCDLDPAATIAAAEHAGTGADLDRAITAAAARLLQHPTPPWGAGRLALNLSGLSLKQPGLADQLLASLSSCGVDPARIVWELSERHALLPSLEVLANLEQLAAAGSGIALDDVGIACGNSPLLAYVPIAYLKTDRLLTLAVAASTNGRGQALLDGLARLVETVGAELIFEGVEDEQSHAAIRRAAPLTAWMQGYAVARPLIVQTSQTPGGAAGVTDDTHIARIA